jgi:hypothetical protein
MYDDVEQPEPASPGGDTPQLDAWKQTLRQQFETWLERVEHLPETQEQTDDAPDLYSLYEELTALRNETCRGIVNRPTSLAGLVRALAVSKMRSDDCASS